MENTNQNAGNLHVTFSKRQSGLFNKANELSVLCGAQLAVLAFTPGGKVCGYGHPDVDRIFDRFLTGINPPPEQDEFQKMLEAHRNSNQEMLNKQLMELKTLVEAEEIRAIANKLIEEENVDNRLWWERPVEELDLQQLEELHSLMEKARIDARQQAHAQEGGAPSE